MICGLDVPIKPLTGWIDGLPERIAHLTDSIR